MKKSRFSDAQIMGILAQAENGVPVSELWREHGMSIRSFPNDWPASHDVDRPNVQQPTDSGVTELASGHP